MKCPLGGDSRYIFRDCLKRSCAWWSEKNEKCAIILIAEKEEFFMYYKTLKHKS